MEHEGSSRHQHNDTMRASKSGGVVIREPAENSGTQGEANNLNNLPQHQSFKHDEQYVPLAGVNRIMRRVLPPNAKISDDAKETMQECVSKFIHFVTSEASERSHRECRKTVSADDIISAMGMLGFDNYVEPLTLFLNKYRSQGPHRNPMHQASFVGQNTGQFHQPMAQLATPPPPTSTTNHASVLPGAHNVGDNNNAGLPECGGFYMGNQGNVDGSSENFEFDPFTPFK